MGRSRKTAYAFWLIIGVLIANPAIISLLVEGPTQVRNELRDTSLADIEAGVVPEKKTNIASKILWPIIYCVVGFSLILNLSLFSIVRYAPPVLILFICLLYTSPSPRDQRGSRMPSSA